MTRTTANLLILLAAAIWGAAFVPQQTAMRVMSPMWFVTLRFLVSILVTAPLLMHEYRRLPERPAAGDYRLIGWVAIVFVGASVLQQVSLQTTSVTNAGFLTSLYILFTPVVAMILTHERPSGAVWPAAALGLGGAWAMAGGLGGGFAVGDLLLTIGAVLWSVQIVLIGKTMRRLGRPLLLVVAQYAAITLVAGGWALLHDPISLEAIVAAAPEILYAGVLSGGVGYTLQAMAQRHTHASDAAIIFSTEAPFAALFGMWLLGDRLSFGQWAGSAAIFAAVLLVQLWPGRTTVASH
ncbi:MAG: DMT family transporter [Siculibacillus sp.]|nr:DMT family transporter [Siculibacillus sp.]